jgi:hypothetical protein
VATTIVAAFVGAVATFLFAVATTLVRRSASRKKVDQVVEVLTHGRAGLPTDPSVNKEIAEVVRRVIREEARGTFLGAWIQGFIWFLLGSVVSLYASELQGLIRLLGF